MIRCCTCLLFCCLIQALPAADPPGPRELVTDLTVRYVNDQVITLSDIYHRLRLYSMDRRQRGLPDLTQEEATVLQGQVLQELTDEILLLAEAEHLGVVVDYEAIKRSVLEDARSSEARTILIQTAEIRNRVREQRIQYVVQYHLGRWPTVSPADIKAAFDQNPARYQRPDRVRCLRLQMTPATEEERERNQEMLFHCFNRMLSNPQLKQVVPEAEFTRILALANAEKIPSIVAKLQAALAATPADPAPATAQLLADIPHVLAAQTSLRDRDAVLRQLTDVHDTLVKVKDTADRQTTFSRLIRELSEAATGVTGGDLGWVEAGVNSDAFDAQTFALETGGLSQVFWDGPAACLVLVAERDRQHQRSLEEVTGSIKAELEAQRRIAARDALMARLRSEAQITDVPFEEQAPTAAQP